MHNNLPTAYVHTDTYSDYAHTYGRVLPWSFGMRQVVDVVVAFTASDVATAGDQFRAGRG